MLNRTVSSVEWIMNVYFGSIKKKFQTKALNVEASNTGQRSNTTARKETVSNNMNATIL